MIGKMRDRITFQLLTIVDTPGGGSKEEWSDEFETWCEAIPLRNGRQLQDNQVVLKSGFKFRIRWAKSRDINKERRIIFNSNVYTINTVTSYTPEGRTRTLQDFYEITAITSE